MADRKTGPKGAIAVDRGRALEVTEGLEDVVVRDRTGAGDAFAGALIGKVAHGWDLLDAVVAGNSAGSAAVARLGAAGALPVTGFPSPRNCRLRGSHCHQRRARKCQTPGQHEIAET